MVIWLWKLILFCVVWVELNKIRVARLASDDLCLNDWISGTVVYIDFAFLLVVILLVSFDNLNSGTNDNTQPLVVLMYSNNNSSYLLQTVFKVLILPHSNSSNIDADDKL